MLSQSKHYMGLVLVFLFAICLFAFSSAAQKSDDKDGTISKTGCLQKGDEANEYSLTADDGKVYGLRSSSVKLSEHVGHMVTVSGQLKPESDEKEEAKEGKGTGKKEAGDIQVSSVKMVSESCK